MLNSAILSSIRSLASSILPPNAKLFLFGSRARGTHRADSDWDLLVVIDKPNRTLNDIDTYGYPFKELGWDIDVEINPLVTTFNQIKSHPESLLYHNIKNDGILIWE